MSTNSFVSGTAPASDAARTTNTRLRSARAGIDWILIGSIMGLILFGMIMIYSAGPKYAMELGLTADYFLQRQVIWVILGLFGMLFASRFDYHWFRKWSVAMMLVTLLMLVAVPIIADTTLNANRSFYSGSIRPSELAKLVIIIYVSVWLYAKREVVNDITLGLLPLMGILGITAGLIILQPDLSAALTIVFLGGILFFLAGVEWRQISLVVIVSAIFGWVVVNLYPTGIKRLTDYFAGLRDPTNASYHVHHALIAVINGGWFGVGIGHSSAKFTGLPVPPTDSIFAVIAEELGLLGALAVIVVFIIILWRGLSIASKASDQLGSLLASGVTIWIVGEAMLNMAVIVNLLPQAGNGLPFISYGGSSLVIMMTAIGILLNVARTSDKQRSSGGIGLGTIVDLRWRDRGRRVSRTGRPANTR